MSLSSEESEERNSRAQPPTPPPRRFLRHSGGSFRLPCLTKQSNHEKPIIVAPLTEESSPSCDSNNPLMSRIAASLRFAPISALAVAGLTPDEDVMQSQPIDRQNHVPLHRASYHGHTKYLPEMNGIEFQNHLQRTNPDEKFIGSAENLVGRVLQEQGLGRYCDPEFVKATQRELAEAINMTPEELDRAAHRLLQAEGRRSNPYLYQPVSSEEDSPYHVPKIGLQPSEGFLLSLQDENRPRSQQNYHTESEVWDSKHFGDTRL